jgi:ubiquinone/menaquinone biosynthesis C-methylase UbiE
VLQYWRNGEEIAIADPPTGIGFKFMSLGFKLRDLFKPRGRVLEETGIQEGDTVLDFGCGPGGNIKPLVNMVGSYGKIYALDINPEAIRMVKNFASRNHLGNIETIISDGETGLTDGSMDYVLLFDVLHHLPRPETILVEFHRILKPDGILAMSDPHMKDEEIKEIIGGSGYFKLRTRNKNAFLFSRIG